MISRILRSIAPFIVVSASVTLFTSVALHAQAASPLVTTRITTPIDNSSLVTLKGNVHPLANAANDRGAAPDSMQLNRVQIVLKRNAAQEAALQQLIREQHTPGSANYHKWLTPAQFGAEFGPSDQDVATVEAWLESQGLSVSKLDPGKQTLEFSGNVAQLRSAFHTQIHKYMVNGATHYANATNPEIPAALAPVVGGFVSLNNFRPKRMSTVLGQATYNPKTNQATPEWTYGNSSGINFVLAPSDFAVQYDLPPGLDGTGQTIAILNDTNINIGLVNQFRTLFGLPSNPPQVIIDGNDPGVDGINNPDGPNYDSVEAYLDVEWAGAVAPGAKVDLVIGADTSLESGLILAAEHAVYSNLAPVVSISFGFGCEATLGTSGNAFLNALWEQAAAQGITVMVSSGDNGSAGCDNDNSQYYAIGGAAVSGLASTPYDVAVGGTDFYYSDYATGGASASNYWSTTPSQNPATSIKGYVPEQPWNDSQYGLNIGSVYTQSGGTQTSIGGGSGGASTVYSKPAWQSGLGVPADSHRDLPDVSLFAANGLNFSFIPICYADADCQPASGSNLVQITGIGGTSASAPAFAGIMALVNEKYGRQGQADAVLYPLAAQFPAAFHDVTHGTNSVPCAYSATAANNSPNCISVSDPLTVTDPTYGLATEGQIGTGTTADYNATTGYDLATGLGSVDASVLINDWNSVVFTSSDVSLTSPTSGASFTHGQGVTFSGTVAASGSSPTPTGDVAIETDSTEPSTQGRSFFALNSGSFTGSITSLPGGTYNVWANYEGDTKNAAAQSQTARITITPEASTTDLSVNDVATGLGAGPAITSGATNIPYGTQLILSAQPYSTTYYNTCINVATPPASCSTPYTQPTGTVSFADNAATINTAVLNAEGDAEFNAPWAIGSHSVTASYSGDNSYNPSTASAFTFSIIKDTPTMNLYTTITTQAGALVGGQQTVLTIQVLNSANLNNESAYNIGYSVPVAAPTGTVTISGFPSGVPTSATLQPGVDSSTSSAVGNATLLIPANTAPGTYSVTVTYPGDSNYASQTASGNVQIQSVGGVATTTTASIAGTISPTTNVTLSGTVTGKSGDPAPSNTNGGIQIYINGYYLLVSVTPGSGDTSTFSTVLNSQTLLQGENSITVQYLGDNTYAPSAVTLTPPISNPLSDFSMVPNRTTVPVTVGTAATDTIQLAPVNGFTNLVNFTCTVPAGITCTINPTSYTFSGGASTATLTLNANSSAADGSNNILITGTDSSGEYVHTLTINAVVSGATAGVPGFMVVAAPSVTLAQGATTGNTVGVSVMPSNGFTGSVALTAAVTSSPSGATSPPTVALGTTPLNITGVSALNSLLTITTTTTTTTGSYTITVTGMSGSTTQTAMINLTVSVPSNPNFALSPISSITISSPGATTNNTATLTITPSGGFTGSVNFSCAITTSPTGATDIPSCAAPPASVTGTSTATSTLTVTTTAATSGALHHPLDKFFAAGGGLVVAALLFFGIPARRRSWRALFVILLFVGLTGLGIGCGSSGSSGGGGGGGGSTGTTTGAYVATVTATDATTGKITSTQTVNITVN